MTARIFRYLPIVLAALAAGWWLVDQWPMAFPAPGQWSESRRQFLSMVGERPLATILTLFLLHVLLATLALPGASLLMVAAGAGFGALNGTLLCLSACTVGATLNMLATRHLLRGPLRRRYGARLASCDARIAEDGAAYLFSLRLLPVIPFALVNIAAGLSALKTWTFIWVSFLGMLAGTFVYVNAGSEVGRAADTGDFFSPRAMLSLAALALLPWLAKGLTAAWPRRDRG